MAVFYAHFAPGRQAGQPLQVESVQQFEQLLETELAQNVLAWMEMLVQHQQVYDAFQLHYYAPPEQLVPVIAWVRSELEAAGPGKPLEFWELGYGWSDAATFDAEAQANAVVQLIATATGEGSPFIIYWRFTDQVEQAGTGVTGLVTDDGPRPAATAFDTSIQKLEPFSRGSHLYSQDVMIGYWFRSEEISSTFVLWGHEIVADEAELPLPDGEILVTTAIGETFETTTDALEEVEGVVFIEELAEEASGPSHQLHLPFVDSSGD